MKTCFVDTNLFIRYFTNDDPHKADRVERLLEQARNGTVRLITADMVIAEVVWVLESAYGLTAAEVEPMIKAILATPGLEVTNKALTGKALHYYITYKIDFIDGYIAALMERMNITEVYSFDKRHLPRISKIKRLEP
jgi:predicted nucleic-acid-binding protein